MEVESAGFNPLKVSNHTKLEPRDTHFTAQASFGDRTRTMSVVDVSVTLIQPHKAYMSRRYGTVVKVEEDIGGHPFYWVVWDDGPVDPGVREDVAHPSRRVVSNRPSWAAEPDRSRWPKEVRERLSAATLPA